MRVKGRVWRFGDSVSTDDIIAGRYKFRTLDMRELAKHAMENLRPGFAELVRPGDLIVAGRNFGCGSSREQAPRVLKELGVGCVVARSFARIFFRNAVNVGLPVVECPEAVDTAEEGDLMEVDLGEGVVRNLSKELTYRAKPLPDFMLRILEAGGLTRYYKKHGRFPW